MKLSRHLMVCDIESTIQGQYTCNCIRTIELMICDDLNYSG